MQITTIEWLRLTCLYTHLLFAALAISEILRTDWAILTGKIDESRIHLTARKVIVILLILWLTGLALIYLDTGFNYALIVGNSKLVLKLVCVLILTLNGIVLHLKSFPLLISKRALIYREALVLAFSGSMSTSHWLLALFVGIAEPITRLSNNTLLGLYLMFVFCFGTGAILSTYWLGIHLNRWKRSRNRVQSSMQYSFGAIPDAKIIKARKRFAGEPSATIVPAARGRKDLKFKSSG